MDSNHGRGAYETPALPAELHRHLKSRARASSLDINPKGLPYLTKLKKEKTGKQTRRPHYITPDAMPRKNLNKIASSVAIIIGGRTPYGHLL